MAGGFGNTFKKAIADHVFRAANGPMGGTATTTTIYVSLHTASPGDDGQTANEVSTSGTAYARQAITITGGAGFAAATTANPSVTSNSGAVTYATATGSGFGTVTHFGLWNHVSNTAAANFIGAAALTASQAVAAGNTASFAAGAITHSFTG